MKTKTVSFIACMIAAVVLFQTSVYAAIPGYKQTTKPINVYIEGEKATLTLPILEGNGRTLYPLRELMELLGVTVDYSNSVITLAKDNTTAVFEIDKKEYTVNGAPMSMDAAAVIDAKVNRTYIPIRFAAEAFGYTVDWFVCKNQNEIWLSKDYKIGRAEEKVSIDGKIITFPDNALPIVHYTYTGSEPLYVPLEYTTKLVGATVTYDKKTQFYTVKSGRDISKLKVGSEVIITNGENWRHQFEIISKTGVVYISAIDLAGLCNKEYHYDFYNDISYIEEKKTKYGKVFLDDKEIVFTKDITPYVDYDLNFNPLMIPAAFLTEYLGGKASFNTKTNSIEISYKGHKITKKNDGKIGAYVDGKQVSTQDPIVVKNGFVYMSAVDYSYLVFSVTKLNNYQIYRELENEAVIYTKEYFEKMKGSDYEW